MMKPWSSWVRAAVFAPVLILWGTAIAAPQDSLELDPVVVRAVRYHVEPARTRIWFETSGTLFYTHYSPDPLTLVVDLPGVDISAITDRTVVGSQEVESITATKLDGTAGKSLSRIEIKLSSLVPYQISATEHALTVLFEGAGSPAEAPPIAAEPPAAPVTGAAAKVPPAPTGSSGETETAKADLLPSGKQEIETAPLVAEPARPNKPANDVEPVPATPNEPPVAEAPSVPTRAASGVDSISHTVAEGLLTVTVGADGRLNYTSFRLAGPPRLVFDFASTVNRVPRQSVVIDAAGVSRARVSQFQSANPKITRIVFDLESDVHHRALSEGNDLKIYFSASADRLAELVPATGEVSSDDVAANLPSQGQGNFPAFGFDGSGVASPVASMEPVAVVAQSLTPAQSAPPEVGGMMGLPEPPQEPPVAEPEVTPGAGATLQRTIGAGEREYTGELISLDFKDGDIQDIFRLFADISGLNIVVQPGVSGRITLVLTEVPWDQALDLILKSHRLGYLVEGNVIRIAPLNELAQEEAERRRLAEEQALAGELGTMIRELSYAKASQVQGLLNRNLSARGDIVIDDRTNTLIVTDLPDRLDTIDTLIETLDAPIPGVEIEARVVVTTRNFTRNLGIQWGFSGHADSEFGNATELTFPNSILLDGASIGSNVDPSFRTAPPRASGTLPPASAAGQRGYAVNLPLPTAPTGAIGLALGSISGAFSLDVALAAAETRGQVRIISSPRIVTQNNRPANIKQGLTFPVQVVANNTVTVTFKEAVLDLNVTPQITSADTIILDITVNNDTPDFGRSVNGIPSIITQSATTQVLVPDGSTTVIGGVFVNNQSEQNQYVPLLHKIPGLGFLFKSTQNSSDNQELLIFLTPRIRKGEV
ncbi:MAG: type IV pilus secretin PilQ [Vicinamibacteria bacterium]